MHSSTVQPTISYPYLPPQKDFQFVDENNTFIQQAKWAQEHLAGDPTYPVGAVLVKEGKVIAKAGNGYNLGTQQHICPRIVLACPTGTGYDLCHLHDAQGHAEQQAIHTAKQTGQRTEGSDLYLYGHWWACEPCWNAMIQAGIRQVYLVDGAHERFSRDNVYAQTLRMRIKTVKLEGFNPIVAGHVKELFKEKGVLVTGEDVQVRCVNGTNGVEIFVQSDSVPVYTLEQSDELPNQLMRVLLQIVL